MKDSALSRLLKLMARPTGTIWLDGRAVTALTEVETKTVAAQSFPNNILLPANPSRIAVGVMLAASGAGGDIVGPYTNLVNFPFSQLSPGVLRWFNIKDYPGLIGNTWYISPAANDDIMVIEVIANPGVSNV